MLVRNHLVILLVSTLTLLGCRKDVVPTSIDLGTNYLPREVGTWIIYDVDSIVHDDNDDQAGLIDTFRFQLKEVVESEFLDTAGRVNQRIERYVKRHDTLQWVIKDVWFSHVNAARAEQVEENQRKIKLVFPPFEGDEWNGNAYNTLDKWFYVYTAVDVPDTVNGLRLDSVLTIVQRDDANLIEREYAEEKYARGIGLVSRTYIFLDFQNQSGIEYYEKINTHGN